MGLKTLRDPLPLLRMTNRIQPIGKINDLKVLYGLKIVSEPVILYRFLRDNFLSLSGPFCCLARYRFIVANTRFC